MADVGDWVQIERQVLSAQERTGKLPEDTRAVPFLSWSKGFLVDAPAQLGDEVTIETVIGRRVTGTLVAVDPGYPHGFGDAYVPELQQVARVAADVLAGGAR